MINGLQNDLIVLNKTFVISRSARNGTINVHLLSGIFPNTKKYANEVNIQ
jgi:hypothetical protein